MVQWGIPVDPVVAQKWEWDMIIDDPRLKRNQKGSVSFLTRGMNTRTTMVFVSLRDYPDLDNFGFVPFGRVIKGLEIFEKLIYKDYGEKPDVEKIIAKGKDYLDVEFPNLSYILSAKIIMKTTTSTPPSASISPPPGASAPGATGANNDGSEGKGSKEANEEGSPSSSSSLSQEEGSPREGEGGKVLEEEDNEQRGTSHDEL